MTRRVTIVGDALLDRDVTGTVERVASDAPVPILREEQVTERPGGAGLAAVLAAGDRAEVTLVTRIGDDEPGHRLRQLLADAGVRVVEVPTRGRTPEKIRLGTPRQPALRLDRAGRDDAVGEPPAAAVAAVAGADAVLVSDYGNGLAGSAGLRAAVADAAARRPVVWDPHPRGPLPVAGCRLVTPNEHEIRGYAVPQGSATARLAVLAGAAEAAREGWAARAVAVTLGADGALLTEGPHPPLLIPVPARSLGDPCGAGDRFATAATLALALGMLTSEAVAAAVGAAAAFVADGGVASVCAPAASATMSGAPSADEVVADVRRRGGSVVATGGCFDLLHAGHVATLTAARALGDCLVVCVNSDASVRGLKGSGRPLIPAADRVRLLSALSCVDAVTVFDEPTPARVLDRLRPDVWVKGGDYFLDDTGSGPALPEAELVRGWGGQAVLVPYLTGYSTTTIIETARAGGHPPAGGHLGRE